MERDAIGFQSQFVRVLKHVGRHRRLAAEFARQRPLRPDTVGEDAAEHPAARRCACDLLHLGLTIDRKQAHAERIGSRDVALLLDRVAVGDAVGGGAGGEHHLDLGDRSGVETGAQPGEQRQHLGRRVCLDGVEHARVWQRLGKAEVVLADDIEVDDEAGAVVDTVAQEIADARVHWRSPYPGSMSLAARIEVQAEQQDPPGVSG